MKKSFPLSRREEKLLLVTLGVAVLGGIYILLVEPLYKLYQGLQEEIEFKRRQLVRSYTLLKERTSVLTEFENYYQNLKLEKSGEELLSIQTQLDKFAGESQVFIKDMKPFHQEEGKFYKALLIELRFEAQPEALFKFLYKLETSPSLFIKYLQVNSKVQETPFLEGVLQVSRFFLLPLSSS